MNKIKRNFQDCRGIFKYWEMLGPVPCIISKIKENYRWQILLKEIYL